MKIFGLYTKEGGITCYLAHSRIILHRVYGFMSCGWKPRHTFSITLGYLPYSIVMHSTGTVVKPEEAPLHTLMV
jgi:hypothetical protein